MNLMKQLATFDTNILRPGTCVEVSVRDSYSSHIYRGIITEASPIALKTEYFVVNSGKPERRTDTITLDHVDDSGPDRYPATGIVRPRRWIKVLEVPSVMTESDMLDHLYYVWDKGMRGVIEDIVSNQEGADEGVRWVLDTVVEAVGKDLARDHLTQTIGIPSLTPEEHLSKFILARRDAGLTPTEIAQEMVNVMGRTVFTVALNTND